jgi:hypothetical protein
VSLTPDAVDARILAAKGRRGRLTTEEYIEEQTQHVARINQARSIAGNANDGTVLLPPEPSQPVQQPAVAVINNTKPHMSREDVKLPAECGFIIPMVRARFVAAWRKYINDELQLEAIPAEGWPQPTSQDYETWRAGDLATANQPSPLAKLMTQADASTIRESSDWKQHRPQAAPTRQRESTFGGITRPGGRS